MKGAARGRHNHARLDQLNKRLQAAGLGSFSTLTAAEPARKLLNLQLRAAQVERTVSPDQRMADALSHTRT